MLVAEFPDDEELRLLDLASYHILDTAPEEDFDQLVELAAELCNSPISLITLIDRDRQWFKSKTGIKDTETSRSVAFCSHAILDDTIMQVEDARLDERFADNPNVTGELNVRFYAGAPIYSPTGFKLGTICVLDHQPRRLDAKQEKALSILSRQVTRLLELRARKDYIQRRAKELLELKNKTVEQTIRKQEEERQLIAVELHENLAQTIAASRMFLSMAEENESMRLTGIQKARECLGSLLNDVRALSNSLSPSAINAVPLEQLVEDFVYKQKKRYPFPVSLQVEGSTDTTVVDICLACIRTIETWMEIIAGQSVPAGMRISLVIDEYIGLTIDTNGGTYELPLLEKEVLLSTIYGRVSGLGGSIAVKQPGKTSVRLEIRLPLEVPFALEAM